MPAKAFNQHLEQQSALQSVQTEPQDNCWPPAKRSWASMHRKVADNVAPQWWSSTTSAILTNQTKAFSPGTVARARFSHSPWTHKSVGSLTGSQRGRLRGGGSRRSNKKRDCPETSKFTLFEPHTAIHSWTTLASCWDQYMYIYICQRMDI